jgi:Holliday junction resolvase RusA-like endonuclease|tara:strand:+ start:202 stop:561 length:360 start_codon:yes stop_codon:yes gene_type:complete
MISVELPYLPPAEFSRNSRVHWTALHRAKDKVYDDIYIALMEAGYKRNYTYIKAKVTLTFYLPDQRNRDADNLITRSKPVLDGLVRAELLADDNLKTIGSPIYQFEYRKRRPGTLIRVE